MTALFSAMSDKSLEQFIDAVSDSNPLRVQDDLGFGYVRLRAAEAQRRQAKQDIRCFEDVVIEMLRNSRDAHSHMIFLASWTEGSRRYLSLLDDGDGIPASMHETIFEPFVTSKLYTFHSDRWGVHGRGMALYSIRQNVESAKVLASGPGLGSAFAVANDSSSLPEKRDQSSLPAIATDAEGKKVLRGPHNIIRTTLEFAIDERDTLAVYYGSSSEIVSTLYWTGKAALDRVNSPDRVSDLEPYMYRFGRCGDAPALAALSQSLGFPMSTRTAYRIIAGEVKPLSTLLETVLGSKTAPAKTHGRSPKQRSIHIAAQDLESLTRKVGEAYSAIADAYYLDKSPEFDVRVKGSELIIKIPLDPC